MKLICFTLQISFFDPRRVMTKSKPSDSMTVAFLPPPLLLSFCLGRERTHYVIRIARSKPWVIVLPFCAPNRKVPLCPLWMKMAPYYVTLQSHQLEYNSLMIGIRARKERNQQRPVLRSAKVFSYCRGEYCPCPAQTPFPGWAQAENALPQMFTS